MKSSRDKCHLLVVVFKYENAWSQIGKAKLGEGRKQKLVGVEIDRTLRFDEYVTFLCRKTEKKRSVLARLSSFMCLNKRRVWMNVFIKSQFGYCALKRQSCKLKQH